MREKLLAQWASLHFCGHTFSISPCLSLVPTFDRMIRRYWDQSLSTELAAKYLPLPAADLGHIWVMLTLSSKGELIKSSSNFALSNQMIGFLSILFRKFYSPQNFQMESFFPKSTKFDENLPY